MQSEHALRYLLLKHLWKLRAATGDTLHAEVARSLAINRLDGAYRVSWVRGGVAHTIDCPEREFAFYSRGDLHRTDPAAPHGVDNEAAARVLAAELFGIAPATGQPDQPLSLYLDVWRWPLLCALAGTVGVFTSPPELAVVVAATAAVESRWRSYWLYFPLAATLVLLGYRVSAVAVGVALAAGAGLASTTRRGRLGALGYLVAALAGWQVLPSGRTEPWASPLVASAAIAAAVIWIFLWLSHEGPRATILLTPLLAVTLLVDRNRDLALAYLAACGIYAVWLVAQRRVH